MLLSLQIVSRICESRRSPHKHRVPNMFSLSASTSTSSSFASVNASAGIAPSGPKPGISFHGSSPSVAQPRYASWPNGAMAWLRNGLRMDSRFGLDMGRGCIRLRLADHPYLAFGGARTAVFSAGECSTCPGRPMSAGSANTGISFTSVVTTANTAGEGWSMSERSPTLLLAGIILSPAETDQSGERRSRTTTVRKWIRATARFPRGRTLCPVTLQNS